MNKPYFTREERLDMLKRPQLHISHGNKKLGNIPSFSSLPGNEYLAMKNGRVVADGIIKGTCNNCAACIDECYAVRTVKLYPQAAKAYAENTILQTCWPSRLGEQLDNWLSLNQPRYFRFFVSGDFNAAADTAVILNTVARHPETQFYTYTKNTGAIEDYKAGHVIPGNITVLASEWDNNPIYGDYPHFIYDNGSSPALRNVKHCPAVAPNGRATGTTCLQCKQCIHAQAGERIAVYAH